MWFIQQKSDPTRSINDPDLTHDNNTTANLIFSKLTKHTDYMPAALETPNESDPSVDGPRLDFAHQLEETGFAESLFEADVLIPLVS